MSLRGLALALVACTSLVWAAGAEATPTELTVRIEGVTRTLFEGPILSDGHNVRASSDTQERRCDGTNGGANPSPGPTPTAAAADAMDLIGQSFDGGWFPGFEDYFIQRWGPDSENLENATFWGVFANGVLIPVGGCQWADQKGDEVLWVYDAFSGRSLLRLATTADPSQAPAAPSPIADVEVGQPLALTVQSFIGAEGQDPKVEPADGVTVAPVATEAGTGYETVETGDPAAVITASDGSASVSFAEPGWHRLKAQEESQDIRSNRLDVCVEPLGGGSCGPLPADAQLRVPERYRAPQGGGGPPSNPPAPVGEFRLRALRVDPRTGTALLEAVVPGPGHVELSGAGVRTRSAEAAGAGVVKLKVAPTVTARRSLRRLGKLRLGVRVEFRPTGGTASSRSRKLTLRLRPPG